MCGIAGWVDYGRDLRAEENVIRAMTDTMIHRGPDGGDVWLSRHAAFGHRRLAVIDIEGGAQPMAVGDAADGTQVVITYGGEIYNFTELRAELAARGHGFGTRSDTEVVLRAYLEWGEAAVERLNGMFAFAIWDARTQELLLARDRLGVKPLYYAVAGDRLLFGSEPKVLLAGPLRAEVDAEGLAELFAVPTAPTPGRTVYRGMEQLRPGHVVRFSRSGVRTTRYWTLSSHPHPDDLDATARRVRDLLADAVRRQLVSDVPIGMLLSGGLDSSALTALAVTESGAPDKLPTFSVEFPPSEEPQRLGQWNRAADLPYAREVATALGTAHIGVLVDGGGLLRHGGAGLTARDRPGWGEPDTSLYLLSRGVREHVTVALSGDVSDEIFGGYPFFRGITSAPGAPLESFPWAPPGLPATADLLLPDVARAVRPQEYARERLREALAEVPRASGEDPEDRRAREITYLALTRWLPALLDRTDRMSMAASLEVRVPFADHRLIEYLWNVPWRFKTAGGTPKGLLGLALADLLPRSVLRRAKSGYPASSSPAFYAEMRAQVDDLLSRDAPVFQLADRAKIARWVRNDTILPGPRAAPHPTGGLDFLLTLDRWLTSYRVSLR
ncbi:asparagine synthetase B [Sphaerisporangium siamense]|uniref:asparagine synthase (glutamine-hydrolyzing) n=1 Tax=Sphaerisporangium siamense TaxID=795645 RepID=A0A7W7D8N9_9ACTN|nr:asparagine synthase (glutamine-hydrolyzing) [Sphaerisporangium siamense]MBB4700971.1 asparagine synthase (glutamine-hydrolyzing) [Sphaerisporangium siamense]GII85883.1 asparagine synthetase B [Sphaerisporangium siamense]